MCPTGNHSQQRPQGFMPDEVFYRILDEIRGRKLGLRFIRWGEPLMHPKVLEFLGAAKRDGHLVHLNTNGSYLTPEMADHLLNVPIDSLKFSVQGVDRDSYREMRNVDFFDKLLETAAMLHSKRGHRERPFLQISTTVTYESKEMQQAFLESVSHYCDATNIGATNFDWLDLKAVRLKPEEIDLLTSLMQQDSVQRTHPECPEVFDKLSVNWNGKVTACCMDSNDLMVIGDITTQPLLDIWQSERMQEFRSLLADMRHDDMELCKHCWDTHNLFVLSPEEP
ncbi:MAG: SPASM domain-containing protein [Alphaproteobacteria bacterium]|nr:SPASM domain-containing protein [Alphaproteobacteria bacterium]